MSDTPTLTPQIVGQAENAHKPILDRILAPVGITRNEWIALTLTVASGGAIESGQLAARMTRALKIDDAEAAAAVGQLTAARLMEAAEGLTVRLTDAGQARYQEIRAAVTEVTDRAYGDIPAGDLATAARVLVTITERLSAEPGSAC
jgi:DNA-binding MarR family transcriptional regulator